MKDYLFFLYDFFILGKILNKNKDVNYAEYIWRKYDDSLF